MKTEQLNEKTAAIKPDQLIGTKWLSWKKLLGDKVSVEFIDKKNCIYVSQPHKYQMTYNVTEGKLFINMIMGAFELRGDVLFNNDLPVFEKTA